MNITPEIVNRLIDVVSHGLIKGAGTPTPGNMCIEQAVAYACGLEFNDNPITCVTPEIATFKRNLNDLGFWLSNQNRAQGLLALGIAQLGSKDVIIDDVFRNAMFDKINTDVMTKRLDYIPIEKRIKEHEKLKQFLLGKPTFKDCRQKFKEYYYDYHYDYHYYNYYNFYYYNYLTPEQKHQDTLLIAKTGLDVLKELKSPGCEFLHLI